MLQVKQLYVAESMSSCDEGVIVRKGQSCYWAVKSGYRKIKTNPVWRYEKAEPELSSPQMHFSCCLKSKTNTLPASVPTQISPLAARTVGAPVEGDPNTALALPDVFVKIMSLTICRVVHRNASLSSALSVLSFSECPVGSADREEVGETAEKCEREGVAMFRGC